jgi:hydroxymethylbilane synthase
VRLRILSRSSDLARVQARLVGRTLQARFPDVDLVYDTRVSAGDRDTATPLASFADKGAFTADLSSALASGAADLVVHSWKDLPLELPSGHVIGATLERADPRDVLLVRRDVVGERPSKLRVLSSSPRRAWLLQDVLPSLLPWRASVETVEVRGNVPTRIAKLLDGLERRSLGEGGRGDALAVAKAALDRLLEGVTDPVGAGFSRPVAELQQRLRQQLDRCAWMVLPIKDVPTAPAQGALAVEISASNAAVRRCLEEISHRPTWDAVCREREVLAQHGGGCHQALGATILPRSYGTITSVRARSANGCVRTWSLDSPVPLPPRTSARYIWPRPDERGHPTPREPRRSASRGGGAKAGAQRTALDVPPPAGTPDLWISRSEALSEHWAISPEQLVWTAGGTTWRRLAARGVWVNGCADGLGDDEQPDLLALAGRAPRWCRLTHADGLSTVARSAKVDLSAEARSAEVDAIATYAVQTPLPEDLAQRTHFFWTSGVLFRDALARWPEIASRWHASGPGRTSRVVSDALSSLPRRSAEGAKSGQFRVFLDYDEWVKEILE